MLPRRSAFTLIELLVVIAIIAILAVVVVLTLNPAQLLAQSRDANRISDLSTLNTALNLYITDQPGVAGFTLGVASTSYMSIFDPTASVAGNACMGLGLPTTSNYSYHCAASSTYRLASPTGWIPINFQNMSAGVPFGSLAVDPTNQTSSDFYYIYQTNGSVYGLSASMESQKYAKNAAIDGGNDPALLESGSGVAILPDIGRGLVGYWNFDEGKGSSTQDLSGGNNSGTWSGTATGTSGYYSPGKVGQWAGAFDGTTTFVGLSALTNIGTNASNITVSLWIEQTGTGNIFAPLVAQGGARAFEVVKYSGRFCFRNDTLVDDFYCTASLFAAINTWYHVVGLYDGAFHVYVNGAESPVTQIVSAYGQWPTNQLNIGYRPYTTSVSPLNGLIDDVRIYNRALSAAEIQALYNATK